MQSPIWQDMFVLGVPLLEKIVRPILVYVFLIAGLRLAGKRELAQLNAFDLVVLLTLSNTVQNAIIGNDNSVSGGIIGATTLLVVNYVVVRFLYFHEPLDRLIEGEPEVLIDCGQLKQEVPEKEQVTVQELEEAAHKQGFASLDLIDRAILEPGGAISFLAKQPTPEETHYGDILQRLDTIAAELSRLRSA